MPTGLEARASAMYPTNAVMQAKWIAAVTYLREKSAIGYALDKFTTKSPARRVLQSPFVAPAPVEAIHTVVSLPDAQVLPMLNVTKGPWR